MLNGTADPQTIQNIYQYLPVARVNCGLCQLIVEYILVSSAKGACRVLQRQWKIVTNNNVLWSISYPFNDIAICGG